MTVATRSRMAASAVRFSPSSLSPLAWLDAGRITGLTDGAAVATWTDASGNGKDATQATSGKRPLYKTNILNGWPVVRFDGTDDYLATPVLGASAARTIIIVAKSTGGQGTPRYWGLNSVYASLVMYPEICYHVASGFTAPAFGVSPGAFRIITVRFASLSAATGFVDGTLAATFDPHDAYAADEPLVLASSSLAPVDADYGTDDIAELLAWNSALSTGDRQQVERYLGAKYAITVT